MNRSARIFAVLTAVSLGLGLAAAGLAQDPPAGLKSKRERLGLSANEGELCAKCHEGFTGPATEEEAFVHQPVFEGRCFDCHEAHAGRHGALLKGEQTQLCAECHADVATIPAELEAHAPVAAGECVSCHDPHRGPHDFGLAGEGMELCAACHEDTTGLAANEELNQHMPFAEGECLMCHSPHAGVDGANLLMDTGELCAACHDLDDEDLQASHLGVPMIELNCSNCHTPHATPSDFLVHEFAHEPFAGGSCDMCHDDSADDPTALLSDAPDLCYACHEDVVEAVEEPVSVHAPAEGGMCLECHTPHASPRGGLVRGLARDTCLACHEDIRERAEKSVSSHLQHDQGNCAACHEPHASQQPQLMRAAGLAACMECHADHGQFAHPMGDAATDPRTGRPLDCLSCHDPHGTQFPYSLIADHERDLCIECHNTVGKDR